MTTTVSIFDQWSDGKRLHVIGTLVLSGSYAQNAEALSFANTPLQSTGNVKYLEITGRNSGYLYQYAKGASRDVGIIRIWQTGAALSGAFAQLGAGALPAGITGDTLDFYAIFDALI